MLSGVIQKQQMIQEITEIKNLLKSIPRFERNNDVYMKNRLENDANDLKFKILKDNEIVEYLKRTVLSSENENYTKEYEDMENYSDKYSIGAAWIFIRGGGASCIVYADF